MAKLNSVIVIATATAALTASAADGQVVTFEFTGVVTELDINGGLFGPPGSVNVGDPFSGHFSYSLGPGNPDQNPADPERGRYNAIELVFDGAVVPLQSPVISVRHQFVPAIFPAEPISIDSVTVFATSPGSQYASGVAITLRGPFEAALMSDALPSDLNLADFTEVQRAAGTLAVGIVPAPSIDDVGTITSLVRVPEPSGLWATGLLAAIAARRRSRRSAPQRAPPLEVIPESYWIFSDAAPIARLP